MIELIGVIAGLLTLLGYLPQTIKTMRTRKTDDLAISTFVIIGLSAVSWTTYGLFSAQPAIWFTNGVVAACSVIIVFIKLKDS